jgi:ParB-like chromosome segregation protein Spo0J
MLIQDAIADLLEASDDKLGLIESLREYLHSLSPLHGQPVDRVRWVPIGDVTPNNYNPNSHASTELGLLYTSIDHDGFTQPIVTIRDDDANKWVIVDGFHRYFVCKNNPDILARNQGRVPIVVIDKPINDRMASTVRHNRARGKHSIDGMSSMVFKMLDNGWSEAEICKELGMEAEEVLRLKHITGFSKLFQDVQYRRAWETQQQIKARQDFKP